VGGCSFWFGLLSIRRMIHVIVDRHAVTVGINEQTPLVMGLDAASPAEVVLDHGGPFFTTGDRARV